MISYIIFSIQLQTYPVLLVLIGMCIQYYPVILYHLGTNIMSKQLKFSRHNAALFLFFVIFSVLGLVSNT